MGLLDTEWAALLALPLVPPTDELWDVPQRCADIVHGRALLSDLMRGKQRAEVVEYLTMHYVEEVSRGELNLQLSGEQLLLGECNAATRAKVACLLDALDAFVFTPAAFSQDLVHLAHERLMAYNPEVAGVIRTRNAKPANTDYAYALPSQITRQLRELCDLVASVQLKSYFERSIKLAALFFNAFLRIHPYSNGNGRLARILTNVLLRELCPVPFSFYSSKRDRAAYLCSFQNKKGEPPIAMASYVFAAVWEQSVDIIRVTTD